MPNTLKPCPDGRKTEVLDAEWIADLLQHGLLHGSFIPSAAQRAVRELTRYRANGTVPKRAGFRREMERIVQVEIRQATGRKNMARGAA